MKRLAALYATVDLRALAAGRIALALVLLLDFAKRLVNLTTWYSNQGLLPNHTLLWRPTHEPTFSPFFMASHSWEAAIGFLFCGLAYVALLLGWRTKAAQVASYVAVLALHGRVMFVQNGGDVVLSLLAMWTVLLPMGERYSVDAWLRNRTSASTPGPQQQSVVSLAFVALLLQLVAIYAFNAVHKDGATWRDGSVVHYVLHQDRIVTVLGLWLRDRMPVGVGQAMTWGALAIEITIPVLLLSPLAQRACRWGAAALILALHTGFALLLNLGIFSAAMMAFTPNLLLAADWDKFDRWLQRRSPMLFGQGLATLGQLVARVDAYLPRARDRLSEQTRLQARETLAGALILLALSQLLVDNRAVPRFLRPRRAAFLEHATTYLQLFQGWGMFAPEAPKEDFTLIVDAVTKDGRHVDPLSEAAAPDHARLERVVGARLGHDSFFCDYISRIAGHGAFHQALIEWVERYPERTGLKRDALASFDLIEITDESPPPGETQPRNIRIKNIFSHKFAR